MSCRRFCSLCGLFSTAQFWVSLIVAARFSCERKEDFILLSQLETVCLNLKAATERVPVVFLIPAAAFLHASVRLLDSTNFWGLMQCNTLLKTEQKNAKKHNSFSNAEFVILSKTDARVTVNWTMPHSCSRLSARNAFEHVPVIIAAASRPAAKSLQSKWRSPVFTCRIHGIHPCMSCILLFAMFLPVPVCRIVRVHIAGFKFIFLFDNSSLNLIFQLERRLIRQCAALPVPAGEGSGGGRQRGSGRARPMVSGSAGRSHARAPRARRQIPAGQRRPRRRHVIDATSAPHQRCISATLLAVVAGAGVLLMDVTSAPHHQHRVISGVGSR